jgi:plasmid stabilization system protein ParE
MSPRFVLHPEAARDIEEIWEFIAPDSVPAASRVREQILEAIRDSARFPQQGHSRSDLTSRPLRFDVVCNYLIAYAPEEKPLLVVAVVDGSAIRASLQLCCVRASKREPVERTACPCPAF